MLVTFDSQLAQANILFIKLAVNSNRFTEKKNIYVTEQHYKYWKLYLDILQICSIQDLSGFEPLGDKTNIVGFV